MTKYLHTTSKANIIVNSRARLKKPYSNPNIIHNSIPDASNAHDKPEGYVETLIALLDEYRRLLKCAQYSNHVLIKRNARLQAELTILAEREAVTQQLAYHDGLTCLPNRRLLLNRFEQAISHSERYQNPLAIILLDLDNFKHVNDKLGHANGDKLLQNVALRLTSSVRGTDTACRYGGDEFVIMLPVVDNIEHATVLAEIISQRLCKPYIIDDYHIHMAVSLGMAIYPIDGTSLDELIKKADTAMYLAKPTGQNTIICENSKAPNL